VDLVKTFRIPLHRIGLLMALLISASVILFARLLLLDVRYDPIPAEQYYSKGQHRDTKSP